MRLMLTLGIVWCGLGVAETHAQGVIPAAGQDTVSLGRTLSAGSVDALNVATRVRLDLLGLGGRVVLTRPTVNWTASPSELVVTGGSFESPLLTKRVCVPQGSRTARGIVLGGVAGILVAVSPVGVSVYDSIYPGGDRGFADLGQVYAFVGGSMILGATIGGVIGRRTTKWRALD
ncbi:MAG: hypothetical protein IT349_00525 [Candidatus Eisenbacteria bacterium]|nr:hypothetical protein [Candidatus Eisenbacteria bacterium]